MEYLMQHPLSSLIYFVAAIGNFFTGPIYLPNVAKYLPYAMGLILLCLYAYIGVTIVFREKVRLTTALSLSLILFALLSAILLTWGRSIFGPEEALSSRYVTVTVLGIVGLYLALISVETKYAYIKPLLLGFLTSLILIGIALSYVRGIDEGRNTREISKLQAYYLSTYRIQSVDNLNYLYWPPDPQTVIKGAEVLEKYNLSVFSRPSLEPGYLAPVEGPTQFHIDTINNSPPSQQDPCIVNLSLQEKTLNIWGWAVDEKVRNAAGGVFVNIDGQIDIPAFYGLDRPDIAERLGESHYRFSGFRASFATSVVGKGQHVISLKIVTADKKGYYELNQKIILEVR
jgi:hypothetical protein